MVLLTWGQCCLPSLQLLHQSPLGVLTQRDTSSPQQFSLITITDTSRYSIVIWRRQDPVREPDSKKMAATRCVRSAAAGTAARTVRGLCMILTIMTALARLQTTYVKNATAGEGLEDYLTLFTRATLPEVKHLGHGHGVIHGALKRHSVRPLTQKGKEDILTIISLGLLLSCDIHPCPGPGTRTPDSPHLHVDTTTWQPTASSAYSLLLLLHLPPPVFRQLCLPVICEALAKGSLPPAPTGSPPPRAVRAPSAPSKGLTPPAGELALSALAGKPTSRVDIRGVTSLAAEWPTLAGELTPVLAGMLTPRAGGLMPPARAWEQLPPAASGALRGHADG